MHSSSPPLTAAELLTKELDGDPAVVRGPRSRRTQAERRAATRGALLEATLESLVEVGYARLTTSDVAARAGVTRGAQAHYFATKAELVTAAMQHLVQKLVFDLVSKPMQIPAGYREQYELLLNRVWEVHAGPSATALLELFVAARTDLELKAQLSRADRLIVRQLHETASLVPELARHPSYQLSTVTALATIRGLWLLRSTVSDATVLRLWQAAKRQLVAGFPEA